MLQRIWRQSPAKVDSADPRYPRHQPLRLLRSLMRLWWLAFAIYPTNALFNIYSLIAQSGVGAPWIPPIWRKPSCWIGWWRS
jgi:hypothetical protein